MAVRGAIDTEDELNALRAASWSIPTDEAGVESRKATMEQLNWKFKMALGEESPWHVAGEVEETHAFLDRMAEQFEREQAEARRRQEEAKTDV